MLICSPIDTVYVKGKHLSYQRGKRNTNPNCSLLKIEGVADTNAAKYVPIISPFVNFQRGTTNLWKAPVRIDEEEYKLWGPNMRQRACNKSRISAHRSVEITSPPQLYLKTLCRSCAKSLLRCIILALLTSASSVLYPYPASHHTQHLPINKLFLLY